MSYPCADDTWLFAMTKTEITCSKCGHVEYISGDVTREIEEALKKHAKEKHGGPYRFR